MKTSSEERGARVSDVPDAPFLTGVGSELWHAVPKGSLAYAVTGPAYSVAFAACGELVRVAPKFGAYDPSTVPVKYHPCLPCRWVVARARDDFQTALDELEHPLAHDIAAGILNEAERELSESGVKNEPVGDDVIDLVVAVARHAPAKLVSEECAEGDCEHAEGGCTGQWACPACSLQAGQWAGEWQGTYRSECTIQGPCLVLKTLGAPQGTCPDCHGDGPEECFCGIAAAAEARP